MDTVSLSMNQDLAGQGALNSSSNPIAQRAP